LALPRSFLSRVVRPRSDAPPADALAFIAAQEVISKSAIA
jgi:hypothetical protein